MTEVIIVALWLLSGALGTYIGLTAFHRRYGSDYASPLWLMTLFGPFNLLGMAIAVQPWDRSRDI